MNPCEKIFRQMVEAINNHHAEGISALLHTDHIYTDMNGRKVVGRAASMESWALYFSIFTDYKLEIDDVFESGNKLMAMGKATASAGLLPSASNSFNIPVALKCVIDGAKISVWTMMADTKIPQAIMDTVMATSDDAKKKVYGFGGVFFKSPSPEKLAAWYDEHLGTRFGKNAYQTFKWRERNRPGRMGRTEFSIFSESTDYYAPSQSRFMLNFRVEDLDGLLLLLTEKGVTTVGTPESFEYGKFAWILDPDGNKIELWQPVDEVLEKYDEEQNN
ncbi:MAG: nuclear transport factor 2 family protein [Flavobacteriales bacterium]